MYSRLKSFFLYSVFLIVFATACTKTETIQEPTSAPANTGFTLPFTWELDTYTFLGDTTITIPNEFLFKKDKTYQVYPLKENLQAVLPDELDWNGLQIVFKCTDGYAASMPLPMVELDRAYIAYRDVDLASGEKNWGDSLQAKFAPFYLVWDEYPVQGFEVPWPYGVFEVEINEFQEQYKHSLPEDEAYMIGFELFQSKCMKCHSINKEGGIMGPEFNFPKNITEYWSKENIWAFLKNPQSFRYSSKMVAVEDISEEEFDQIYAYLVHITDKKIKEE